MSIAAGYKGHVISTTLCYKGLQVASRSRYRVTTAPGMELHGCFVRPLGIECGTSKPLVMIASAKGSSMEEERIEHLACVASLCGLPSFMFNYRGESMSKGEPSEDKVEERNDTKKVIKEVLQFYPGVIMIGFEMGAMIFGSLLRERFLHGKIHGFASMGYPVDDIKKLCGDNSGAGGAGASTNSYEFFQYELERAVAEHGNHYLKHPEQSGGGNMLFVQCEHHVPGSKATSEKQDQYYKGLRVPTQVITQPFGVRRAHMEELEKVMGPWMAQCAGTTYSPDPRLMGFRPA